MFEYWGDPYHYELIDVESLHPAVLATMVEKDIRRRSLQQTFRKRTMRKVAKKQGVLLTFESKAFYKARRYFMRYLRDKNTGYDEELLKGEKL